jgi:uncharacterized protein (TIRG00374 family)
MTTPSADTILANFSLRKILIPIFIGILVTVILMLRNVDWATLDNIDWSEDLLFWLFIATIILGVKHLLMMARLKILTSNRLNWRQCFEVISIWELGSAVTPSTVGGTAVGMFLLAKERIKGGEAIAIIMFMIVWDTLFFMLGIPLVTLLGGWAVISPALALGTPVNWLFLTPFMLAYAFLMVYLFVLVYGLFINPKSVKYILVKIMSLPLLNRWKNKAVKMGDDMIIASNGNRKKSWGYWLGTGLTTFVNWIGRFLILNAIFVAFGISVQHLILFGRQLIIYILMIASPTPGGSGVAEWIFGEFLYDYFPTEMGAEGIVAVSGLWVLVAFIWRLLSFYPYLLIGVATLPAWLHRIFGKKSLSEVK